MEERCERTDLLVDQCACPKHRAPVEPRKTGPVPWSGPDGRTARQSASRPFEARYGGMCADCGGWFEEGDMIQYNEDGELIAIDCCGES